MINMICDVENVIKNDKTIQEIDVLERHPNGYPKVYYFKMKLTGMSARDGV